MSYTDALHSDLRKTLQTVTGLPPVVVWQGRKTTTPVPSRHVKEQFMPVDSNVVTLGQASGQTQEDAVYAVTIMSPAATADLFEDYRLADAIAATFWTGRGVGGAAGFGNVTKTSRGVGVYDENTEWLMTPVRIRLFIRRRTWTAPWEQV